MKVISAKFVNTVRVPGRTPSMEMSVNISKGVGLDYAAGLLRVSYAQDGKTTAIAVPAANIAYLELEPETDAAAAPKGK